MLKKTLFVIFALITIGASVWFYFVQKRNKLIDILSANPMVTTRSFDQMPTSLLTSWVAQLNKIENGELVSYSTFTHSGSNYNIKNGNKI